MKKRKYAASIAFILLVALAAALFMGNTAGAPGSEVDPVVTKSYVENYVTSYTQGYVSSALQSALTGDIQNAINNSVNQAKSELRAELKNNGTAEGGTNQGSTDQGGTNQSSTNQGSTNTGETASAATFVVVNVPAGTKLIGKGGTELILRGGSAVAIDNGVDGISDLTGAKDLLGGTKISLNHLLLVPRDDGRGIQATSEIWVMVKGEYTLQ